MPAPVDLYRSLPLAMLEAFDRYLNLGIRTGSGYRSILENDLIASMRCGDEETIANLRTIVRYLYNMCPSVAWGSPAKVNNWLMAEPKFRAMAMEHCAHDEYLARRRQEQRDFVESCRDNDKLDPES